jgi:two-component system, OmpR family, phosphate regulon sensor histidine kinase PhoR
MKKFSFFLHPVVIFVLAQLAWVSLLGIWIYWYVTNYIIFNQVGDKISPQLISAKTNIVALVMGIVLLTAILVGMYLIFIYLNRQMSITRLYDNFIANVTHELKSPLASIQLYLETLKIRQVPPNKQQEFISLMITDANRLKNLINSILEIAAFEQKKVSHNFHVYDGAAIVNELLGESREQFRLSPQSITITGNASCEIVIDRNAFKIVFDNLVDNAMKYSLNPVQITVHLHCSAKTLVVEFNDQGIGLSIKKQFKIFDKFHRIYHKDIPNVKGTGLGLYWVKQILKHHGGKISVYSAGKNMGTTFRLELPIYRTYKKRYVNYLLELTRKKERQQ